MLSQRENALVPRLDATFLSTLTEAVRVCGYTVDYIESSAFVAWCHEITGATWLASEREPYPLEEGGA